MFGYLRPYKEELRLKDIKKYSAFYCALCNQIRADYGLFWTLFLNYESVYILLLLDSVMDCPTESMILRCHLNPFMKRKIKISHNALKYSAFINMMLIKLKLEDDEYDEKKFGSGFLEHLLNKKKKFTVMQICYKELISELKTQSDLLRNLENENGTLDSCADTTGNMLVAIINYWLKKFSEQNIRDTDFLRLHLYIGKFIYILDAYEDLEKDIKKNQYNPIMIMETKNHISGIEKTEKILALLKSCINQEVKNNEIIKNNILLENILVLGLEHTLYKTKEKRCTRRRH